MNKQLRNLSLNDLEIISILPRYESLRSLARDLRTTPSNISVKLTYIEQELELTIMTRSARGYLLTKDGAQLARIAGEVLGHCENLVAISKRHPEAAKKWFTFGSRGFINSLLAPIIINCFESGRDSVNFRFIDFSPQELVVAAFRSSLDIAVTLEECFLGERWQSKLIGETRRVLLARKGHPLETSNDIAALEKFRVLRSAYWDGNSVVSSGDLLPRLNKRTGCELQTAATAIPVVLSSDCIAYLPRLAVGRAIETKQVVELFPNQTDGKGMPVFLHINKDSVSQKMNQSLLALATEAVHKFG